MAILDYQNGHFDNSLDKILDKQCRRLYSFPVFVHPCSYDSTVVLGSLGTPADTLPPTK